MFLMLLQVGRSYLAGFAITTVLFCTVWGTVRLMMELNFILLSINLCIASSN